MNVTIITSMSPVKGISAYSQGLVEALSKKISVDVLGFNHIYPGFLYPGEIFDNSAKQLEQSGTLKIRNVLNWYNPIQWVIEAFRIKTDIIHAQWWSYPLAPIYLAILGINKLRGKHIVLTIHNVKPHENSKIKALLNRCVFGMADHYIVHTMQNKQELACITKTQKPITVLPHGLILTQPQDIDRQQARQELGILPTDKVALCFGAIRDYKGLDTAIKALALVQDKDIKLMVAGQCWEDWSKYEKLIIEYQLQERIILKLGFIPTDQVDAIIKSSDLILLPYKHFDAQSGVGALVLPYGIPIIVSRVGGLIDYTTDQNLSFEADDVDDLAVKINNIFINENLYSKSIKAMDEMMQVLDWSVITNSLVKLYRSTSK